MLYRNAQFITHPHGFHASGKIKKLNPRTVCVSPLQLKAEERFQKAQQSKIIQVSQRPKDMLYKYDSPSKRPAQLTQYEKFFSDIGDSELMHDNDYEVNYIPLQEYIQFAFYRKQQIDNKVQQKYDKLISENVADSKSKQNKEQLFTLPDIGRQRLQQLKRGRSTLDSKKTVDKSGMIFISKTYTIDQSNAIQVLVEQQKAP